MHIDLVDQELQQIHKEQYPYGEKICYSFITIIYCAISIFILQNYCINPVCELPTSFARILIIIFYGAMLIRVIFFIMITCSFCFRNFEVPTIILEQKLCEAEFFVAITFWLYVIFFYVLAEPCRTQQIAFAVMFCMTYVILRLTCLPQGVINYFDGEYF